MTLLLRIGAVLAQLGRQEREREQFIGTLIQRDQGVHGSSHA